MVSVLLLNLAAEVEPNLSWGNFDGLERQMESNGCYKARFPFKVLPSCWSISDGAELHHADGDHPQALPHSCPLHPVIHRECQDGLMQLVVALALMLLEHKGGFHME